MSNHAVLPGRLMGKTVLIHGKYGYSEKEQLQALAEGQEAKITEALTADVNYLVLPDLAGGVTLQKKVRSLNAKGADIQVLDQAAFTALMMPTLEELATLLRAGAAARFNKLLGGKAIHLTHLGVQAKHVLLGENFDGLPLAHFVFGPVGFSQCSFAGAGLAGTALTLARECNFAKADLSKAHLWDVPLGRFNEATLTEAHLAGDLTGADFSDARMERAVVQSRGIFFAGRGAQPVPLGDVVFRRARLAGARLDGALMVRPIFEYADLTEAGFVDADLEAADFRGATGVKATFAAAKLQGADFSGADLQGANFGEADMRGARMDGANLAGCNFRGASLTGVDFTKARNYEPNATSMGMVGPALKELDTIVAQARRIEITVNVGTQGEGEPMNLNSSGLKYGWGVRLPASIAARARWGNRGQNLSDALLRAANLIGDRKIRFETLDVSSTKSPKGGKELRDLVIKGLEEAFVQTPPAAEELEKLTKAYRDKDREKNAALREVRDKERAAAEKAREKEKKQAEKKIEKAIGGKVKDISTFLTALELRIEKSKIDKAASMLKKSGFQLYNDITETFMSGVVKSQTDPDLVYACRINQDGTYACCTQNLNVCGGLRGSICKHLLVLIIGLVKAGELDPTTIDGWVAKSLHEKAALDKEKMGEIFIKYKGAEAGEVDWRPTETLPEDYYAV